MTIYNLLQDQKSYIWIGTDNGLCRYEGTTFKTYNSPLLKGNEILQTYEHPDGKIYFHNLEGQLGYVENDQIHLYKPEGFIDTLGIRGFEFTDEALWIIPFENMVVIRYSLDAAGNLSNRIRLTSDSNHFIINKGTVFSFSKLKEVLLFDKYTFSNSKGFVKSPLNFPHDLTTIRMLINTPDDRTIITSFNKAYTLEGDTVQLIAESPDIINQMRFFDDQLYLLTNNGLHIKNLQDKYPPLSILKGISTNTALLDKEGNLWVGTAEKGLYLIPSLDFQVYQASNSPFLTNRVHSLYYSQKNKKLLVGQGQGHLTIMKNRQVLNSIKTKTEGRITAIEQDQEGYYYLGNDQQLSITDSSLNFLPLWHTSSVKHLAIVPHNNLIVCSSSSTNLYFSDEENKRLYQSQNKIKKQLIAKRSYAAIEAFSGTYWLGTPQGLYTYSDTLRLFTHAGQPLYCSVNTISQAFDSTIWVGTQSDGLIRIKDNKFISSYTKTEGLVSNKVKELYIDEEQTLWIGTDKGVQIMSPQAEIRGLVNKLDGLPSNDITAIYVDSAQVWLGTPEGLVTFPKKSIHKNSIPPSIRITAFKIWERDSSLQGHYNLNHYQNNLSITFEGIAFRSRGTTRYQYRMIGIDSSWIDTDSRLVRFLALNPGDYRFEVVAVNEDGQISEAPASISLSISPPWWKTLWFITLAILGSIGLIASIFYARLKHLQKREQEKQAFNEQVNELKMQALQVQMNPHFVFNALNAIQKYLTTNEQEQAMIYLARFARLIRLIFEQSKKKEISLEEELEFLRLYLDLEKLRFNEKVEIQLTIEEEVTQEEEIIKIPPLLIQPVIENAFKHGLLHKKEKGFLKIRFSREGSFLVCMIEDNGVGRKKAKTYSQWKPVEYHSSGLETTKQRLAIFNNKTLSESSSALPTIHIEDLVGADNDATGTRVTIHMHIKSYSK